MGATYSDHIIYDASNVTEAKQRVREFCEESSRENGDTCSGELGCKSPEAKVISKTFGSCDEAGEYIAGNYPDKWGDIILAKITPIEGDEYWYAGAWCPE